jgi:hypothetical protein
MRRKTVLLIHSALAAGDYFLVALLDEQIVGYACGTLTKGTELSHETMYRHHPAGGELRSCARLVLNLQHTLHVLLSLFSIASIWYICGFYETPCFSVHCLQHAHTILISTELLSCSINCFLGCRMLEAMQ